MLALALGGRTISELKASMTQREFREWVQFYIRWPFDDLHRYHRPAALVSTSMSGAPVADLIEFLQPSVTDEVQADATEKKAWLDFLYS